MQTTNKIPQELIKSIIAAQNQKHLVEKGGILSTINNFVSNYKKLFAPKSKGDIIPGGGVMDDKTKKGNIIPGGGVFDSKAKKR